MIERSSTFFYKFYCWRDEGLGFVNCGVRFASGILGKFLIIVPEEKWSRSITEKKEFVRLNFDFELHSFRPEILRLRTA